MVINLGNKKEIAAVLKALGIKKGVVYAVNNLLLDSIISLVAADNGSKKTQDQWRDYFNSRNELMLSMPDLYRAGKTTSEELLQSLQQNFQASYEVTSTSIIYSPKVVGGRIIHRYKCNSGERSEYKCALPFEGHCSISDILCSKVGLSVMQALLDTEDSKGTIIETFGRLSGYSADKLSIYFCVLKGRAVTKTYPVSCGVYAGSFSINIVSPVDGFSRNVYEAED